MASAAAADAVRRVEAGESLDSLAKAMGATMQAPRFAGRTEQTVPMEIRRAAFEAPKPAAGKPIYRGVALDNGDFAVYGVSAVREDPTVNPQQQDTFRRQFALEIGASESQGYAAAVRADAKVIVNPQSVD